MKAAGRALPPVLGAFLVSLRPLVQANIAWFAIVFVALSAVLPVWAQTTPVGLWRSIDDKTGQPRAEIRIKAASNGTLSGVIEKAIVPSPEPLCSACPDDRKDQPKLGLEIIRGALKAEDKPVWEGGSIIDPDNGRIYKLRLTPVDAGNKLEVRGAFGPFWRTQTWIKVQ